MCTKYYCLLISGWAVYHKYLSLGHFNFLTDHFTPLADEENKTFIKQKKEKSGDNLIVHMCTKYLINECMGGWYDYR